MGKNNKTNLYFIFGSISLLLLMIILWWKAGWMDSPGNRAEFDVWGTPVSYQSEAGDRASSDSSPSVAASTGVSDSSSTSYGSWDSGD